VGQTVLEIGNAAATVVGLPEQSTLLGNTNQNARRILKAVKDAARDAFHDIDWVRLTRTHTFATDGSSYYLLPTYYDRIVNGTIWDRTNYKPVLGPMTRTEWQKYESGLVSLSGIYKACRIFADDTLQSVKRIGIYPETDTGSTIAFDYIDSRYVVVNKIGSVGADITADDNEFLMDDHVIELGTIWRLLRMLGLNYTSEQQEYFSEVQEKQANDSGAPVLELQLGRAFAGRYPNLPDSGFGV